jgi:hypothetical protein
MRRTNKRRKRKRSEREGGKKSKRKKRKEVSRRGENINIFLCRIQRIDTTSCF